MTQYTNQPPFQPPYGMPGVGPIPPFVPPQPPPAGKRKFSYLTAMLCSAFSKELWVDVARNWRGIGLLYMILLLVITWVPVLIKAQVGFSRFVQKDSQKLIGQLPKIMIQNGVVSIDKPEPYEITEPDSGRVIAIIDTTGKVTQPPSPMGILVTRTSVIQREANGNLKTTDLSQIQSFSVDQARVNGWLDIARTWFFPGALAAVIIFGTAWRLILMLIGGAIGLMFASAFKAPVQFAGSMRLAAIAMTPGMLLGTALTLPACRCLRAWDRLPGSGCSCCSSPWR